MKANDGQGAARLKIQKLGPYTHKAQGLPLDIDTSATEPGPTP